MSKSLNEIRVGGNRRFMTKKVVRRNGKRNEGKARQLTNEIDNFLILCIYEQQKEAIAKQESIEKEKAPIYYISGVKSFMIWEKAYQENPAVFNSLRQIARDRFIHQLADHIVHFLIEKNKNYSSLFTMVFLDHQLRGLAISAIENRLRTDTFLNEEAAWEEFCQWFQRGIAEWVLDVMADELGMEHLSQLKKAELNQLFYQYLSNFLLNSKEFLSMFTIIVNDYADKWINQLFKYSKCTVQELEKAIAHGVDWRNSSLVPSQRENICVMNNAPYQAVREALYQVFHWDQEKERYCRRIQKGHVQGLLMINEIVEDQNVDRFTLTDLDVDVLDMLCANFLAIAKHHEDVITIEVDELLRMRGLLPKRGGEGRRGGYERSQRLRIMKSLTIIKNLWIDIETVVYQKGKPVEKRLMGNAFDVYDQNESQQVLKYKMGPIFSPFLYGSGRQVIHLPLKILQYDPYRRSWEKRLGRYMHWRWRVQAKKGDYLKPHYISTLLAAIGESLNIRLPSRTRERFESALDTLQEDGLLSAWYYEAWEESIVDSKGWGNTWKQAKIIIQPPEEVVERYAQLKKTTFEVKVKDHQSLTDHVLLGKRVREVRVTNGLSLSQLAQEVEVSQAYISTIERGIKVPSKRVEGKLLRWIEIMEKRQ